MIKYQIMQIENQIIKMKEENLIVPFNISVRKLSKDGEVYSIDLLQI